MICWRFITNMYNVVFAIMINSFYKITRIYPHLKIFFYTYYNRLKFRFLGINFGKDLRVYNRIYIRGKGNIFIGNGLIYTSGDDLNPLCRNIRGMLFTATKGEIHIGDNVGISSACLWAQSQIRIGSNVNIGADTLIMDTDAHPLDYIQRRSEYFNKEGKDYYNAISTAPVLIDDDVWIGARCIILKGVHIGARSVIAAGSIVTKDIPEDVIAGGNPARVIRNIIRK